MTKQDIVNEISDKTGIEREDSLAVLEASLMIIKDHMARGENIYIRGFGTFRVVKRKEKKGRNITKGTMHIVPEHYAPSFKPSDMFKEKVRVGIQRNNESLF